MVAAFPFSQAPHIVDEQDSGPNSFKQGQVVMPCVNLNQDISMLWPYFMVCKEQELLQCTVHGIHYQQLVALK